MVQKNAVYRKSAAGLEALARRDPAVSLRLRSVLILLDGKRGLEEVARLSGGPEDLEPILAKLHEAGMIEQVGGDAASVAATGAVRAAVAPLCAAPSPASSTASTKLLSLADAQRIAVRRLTDLLGPGAEDLCLRIEAARTPQEFQVLVKRAEGALRGFGGAPMANSFLQALEGYRTT